MKYKFYYNGKIVRTSEHDYKFAVIREKDDGKICCLGCSSTRKGIESVWKKAKEIEKTVKDKKYLLVELEKR